MQEVKMADQEMKSAAETTENMEVDPPNTTQKQANKEAMAEAKKAEGNREYGLKNYTSAITLYSQAIDLAPHIAMFYGNRSAAYMMISQYEKALEDALISIKINENFVKGHYRAAKCYLAMGSSSNALRELQKVLELDPKNKDAKNDMRSAKMVQDFEASALEAYDKKDYRKVVFCMRNVLEISPAGTFFRVLKAEALAMMEKYSDAESEAVELLRKEPNNTDALYVRGMCLYYQDNVDKAYQHFAQVMKRDPDHKKARQILRKAKLLQARKKEGNDAFTSGHYQKAYELYTEALEIDPLNKSTNAKLYYNRAVVGSKSTNAKLYYNRAVVGSKSTNAKLYYNRAVVGSKLGKTEGAIEDCSQAINLDHTYFKAYLKRANCYMDAEQYEEAVRDYEALCKKDRSSREYRRLLEKAKLELKKSKRKDYYKILGIEKGATEEQIKKAYKKEALKHHPDRHSGASEETKMAAEKQFKEVNEAYSILSDPKKRMRYDSGQDLEEGFGMPDDFDPNSIFQAFFGGPGGFVFNFGGAGPGGAGPGPYRQSDGYPGGGNFTFTFG